LHEHALRNAQVSLGMCNVLIISGSFPTIFICVFRSLHYKLHTWLTCNCVNILYQPATPVTTRVKSIFLFLRDTPVSIVIVLQHEFYSKKNCHSW